MYRQSTDNAERDRLIEERDDLKIRISLAAQSGRATREELKEMHENLFDMEKQIQRLWARASKG